MDRIRLRCRAHNQFEAESTFGTEFMSAKRDRARSAGAAAQVRAQAEPDPERDVTPWLRRLGFRLDEARRAAAYCATLAEASLEERLRAALSFLVPPPRGATNLPRSVAQAR